MFEIKQISIEPKKVIPFLNKKSLFKFHWHSIPKNMEKNEQEEFIKKNIEPIYERIKNEILEQDLLELRGVYSFVKCKRQENNIIVYDDDNEFAKFNFESENEIPFCFFCVTIGEKMSKKEKQLKDEGKYVDYLYYHGFGVCMAEAFAEYIHREIIDKSIENNKQTKRYSFGYPECSELSNQKIIFKILYPEKIGIELTSSFMMDPEASVSAFVV
jgi:5-methyltetrahydrofolate--homocysteine methyltransferase